MVQSDIVFRAFVGLHLVGLAFGLGGAFIADFAFFKSVRQGDRISPETVAWMRSFSQVVWIGLGLLVVSGAGMFLSDTDKYLHSTGFMAKMLLVAVLVINGLFLNFYSTARLTTFNFSQKYTKRGAAWRARKLSFVFGAISAVTWYSVLGIALFKDFLSLPLFVYIAAYIVLLGAAVTGSLVLEQVLYRRAQTMPTPEDLNKVPLSELANYSVQKYKAQQSRPPDTSQQP